MCNHPDLLEPRPVESPFLIAPLKIHLPRLLISILSHDLARGYTGPVWQKLPITGIMIFCVEPLPQLFNGNRLDMLILRPWFQCVCPMSIEYIHSSFDPPAGST